MTPWGKADEAYQRAHEAMDKATETGNPEDRLQAVRAIIDALEKETKAQDALSAWRLRLAIGIGVMGSFLYITGILYHCS